ncbi:cuticle protein 38-like [Lucilia sericata]|uniref:cuticle protein 38-like n=1 Tax=Lucilia sericata TaxID=13632 RepID=UPI0018A7F09D|nr:cuticle protein 38-like [Lucilia sericata]
MFKFVAVFAACLSYATAGLVHPTAFAAAPAGVAYANAPLYAAGGSQQVDVRQNYDGTFSSYTTNPFGFAAPYSSRYVAGAPATFAAPAKYFGPAGVAAAPFAAASPYASPYAAHLAAAAYNAYANAYAASPVSAPVA